MSCSSLCRRALLECTQRTILRSEKDRDSSRSAIMSTAKPNCIPSKSAGSSSRGPAGSHNQSSAGGELPRQDQQLSSNGTSSSSASEKAPVSQNQPSPSAQLLQQNQQPSANGTSGSSSSKQAQATQNQISSKDQRPPQNHPLPNDSTPGSPPTGSAVDEPLRVLALVNLSANFESYGIQWWHLGLHHGDETYGDENLRMLELFLARERPSVQEQQLFERQLFEPENNDQTVKRLCPVSSKQRLIASRCSGFLVST